MNYHWLYIRADIENRLRSVKLWDSASEGFVEALTSTLDPALRVDPVSGQLSIACTPEVTRILGAACQSIELSRLQLIWDQLLPSPIGPAIRVVLAHCYKCRLPVIARPRFVIVGRLTPESQEWFQRARDVFDTGDPIGCFLAESFEDVPPGLLTIGYGDERAVNDLAQRDSDVARWIDALAFRSEKLATHLFQLLRPIASRLFDSGESGCITSMDRESAIREGLQWTAVILHCFWGSCYDRFPKGEMPQCWLPAAVLLHLVSQSLFDGLMLDHVRRVLPGFLRSPDVEESVPASEDVIKAKAANLHRMSVEYRRLQEYLYLIQSSWESNPLADPRIGTDDKRLFAHLARFRDGLHSLFWLYASAQGMKTPKCSQFTLPNWLKRALPNMREVQLAFHDQTSFEPTSVFAADSMVDLDDSIIPDEILDVEHVVGLSNLLRIKCRVPALGNSPYSVAVHHSRGEPCHFPHCILPLNTLFHPEDRLVIMAEFHVRQATQRMRLWPMGLEFASARFGAESVPGILSPPLYLIHVMVGLRPHQRGVLLLIVPRESAASWVGDKVPIPLPQPLQRLLDKNEVETVFKEPYCLPVCMTTGNR